MYWKVLYSYYDDKAYFDNIRRVTAAVDYFDELIGLKTPAMFAEIYASTPNVHVYVNTYIYLCHVYGVLKGIKINLIINEIQKNVWKW